MPRLLLGVGLCLCLWWYLKYLNPEFLKNQGTSDNYKGVLVTYRSYETGFEFEVKLDILEPFEWSKFGLITASTDEMGIGTDFGDYCLGFKYDDVSYYAEFSSVAKSQEVYFNELKK